MPNGGAETIKCRWCAWHVLLWFRHPVHRHSGYHELVAHVKRDHPEEYAVVCAERALWVQQTAADDLDEDDVID